MSEIWSINLLKCFVTYIYYIPSCVSALTHVLARARQLLGCRGSRTKERDISVLGPHQGADSPRGTRHLCPSPSSRGSLALRNRTSLSRPLIKGLSRPEERDISVLGPRHGAVSPRGTRYFCPGPSSWSCLAPRNEISLSWALIMELSRPEERDISVPAPHQGAVSASRNKTSLSRPLIKRQSRPMGSANTASRGQSQVQDQK